MRKRKFLLTTGSAILGSSIIQSVSQKPTVALDFQLEGFFGIKPSDTDSISINFNSFQITPLYIDETQNPGSITITVQIESGQEVTKKSDIDLYNGQKINKSDIIDPIVIDNIQTNKSILEGSVTIKIEHPSVSDTFTQSFIVTNATVHQNIESWWPLNDQSGDANEIVHGYNGVLNGGGIVRGSDQIGQINSYYFDGSSYIDAGNQSEYRPNDGDFTAMLWFKTDKNKDYYSDYPFPRILTTAPSSPYRNSDGWTITITRQNILGIFNDGTNESAVKLRGPEVDDANWHHVALQFSRDDSVRLYLDGEKVSESIYTRSVNQGHPLTIGATSNYGNYYPGYIADIRIYQDALSTKQIKTVYNRGNVSSIQESINKYQS